MSQYTKKNINCIQNQALMNKNKLIEVGNKFKTTTVGLHVELK